MRHRNSNLEGPRVRWTSLRPRPRLAQRTAFRKVEALAVRFLALVVFVALLQAGVAQAQVTLDVNTGSHSNSSNSFNWTHNVGSGSNLVILVAVSLQGTTTVSTVKWNSTSLNCLFAIGVDSNGNAQGSCSSDGNSPSRRSEIWGAALGSPGATSGSVAVTLSGSTSTMAGSASFKNAAQSGSFGTGEGTAGQNSPASLSFSGLSSNGAVMDDIAISTQQPITGLGGSQTSLWSAANGSNIYGSSSYATGAVTSMSQSWTGGSTHWAYIAVPINPATTSGPARKGQTIVGQLVPPNVGNLWQ